MNMIPQESSIPSPQTDTTAIPHVVSEPENTGFPIIAGKDEGVIHSTVEELQLPELPTDTRVAELPKSSKWNPEQIATLQKWADSHRAVHLEHTDGRHFSEGVLIMASNSSVWINNMKTWEHLEDGRKRLADVGPYNGAFALTGRSELDTFSVIRTTDSEPASLPPLTTK